MALVVGTDTYVTVDGADDFLVAQLGTGAWVDASAGDQGAALRMACIRMEALFYLGVPADEDQVLKWPRSGVYDQHGSELDDAVVPQAVKDAQCWEALAVLQWSARGGGASAREELQKQGVVSTKLGDMAEAWKPAVDLLARCLSERAMLILGPFVAFAPAGVRRPYGWEA